MITRDHSFDKSLLTVLIRFNGHVLTPLEISDLKEVRILLFIST